MLEIGQIRKHVQTLDKGDDAARRQAIQALKAYEEKDWANASAELIHSVIESLLHQLPTGTKPPFMHKEVATILGNMGIRAKPAIRQLIELLLEGIPDPIREAAAGALGKIGPDAKAAVDHLVVLTTGKNTLAIQAVRALSGIGCADSRVKAALVNLWLSPVQTQNNQVQVAIALCKLKIDARGLLSVLTATLMGNQDAGLRKSAAEALAWCGKNDPDVVPALLTAALSDKNDDVKLMAQNAIDQMNITNESAVHICAKQLKESTFAETALRKSGAAAVPALIKALASDEPTVRVKAARNLASLGELAIAAVPALTAALRDRDAEIRLAAAKGLWNINKNADDVVPVLVGLLEQKPTGTPVDPETRRRFLQTVIEALWRIGPPAIGARPALLDKTKDKNRLVSESAQNALKKIAPTMALKASGVK